MLCGLHTGHARDITICVYITAASKYMGFLELKKFFFKRGVLGAAKFRVFLVRRYVSLRFFNEQEEVRVSPARRSQLATAAVCKEQHQMKIASCSQSYLTQLIEYGEGLQRIPELERRRQKICGACCRFLHEVP